MSRYIDADVLLDIFKALKWYASYSIVHGVPTADVEEVVQCKDCKHFHDGIYNGEYWMECDEYRIALSSDEWFCADGERREDDKG